MEIYQMDCCMRKHVIAKQAYISNGNSTRMFDSIQAADMTNGRQQLQTTTTIIVYVCPCVCVLVAYVCMCVDCVCVCVRLYVC